MRTHRFMPIRGASATIAITLAVGGVAGAASQPSFGADCDPNYSGACVPMASDVNCDEVDGPVTVVGQDIYDLDRDGDGIGCDGGAGGSGGGAGGGAGAGGGGGGGNGTGGGGAPVGGLAETGSSSATLVGSASVAVLGGALALLAARRRTA